MEEEKREEAGGSVENPLEARDPSVGQDPQPYNGEACLGKSLGEKSSQPVLHLFEPCTAEELSERRGGWCSGGGPDPEQVWTTSW